MGKTKVIKSFLDVENLGMTDIKLLIGNSKDNEKQFKKYLVVNYAIDPSNITNFPQPRFNDTLIENIENSIENDFADIVLIKSKENDCYREYQFKLEDLDHQLTSTGELKALASIKRGRVELFEETFDEDDDNFLLEIGTPGPAGIDLDYKPGSQPGDLDDIVDDLNRYKIFAVKSIESMIDTLNEDSFSQGPIYISLQQTDVDSLPAYEKEPFDPVKETGTIAVDVTKDNLKWLEAFIMNLTIEDK